MIPNPNHSVCLSVALEDVKSVNMERRIWWRWHFAGQIAAGFKGEVADTFIAAKFSVEFADALIAVLERGGK
jgi:hypothetical protein